MKAESVGASEPVISSVPSVVKVFSIFQAESPVQIAHARQLFLEYAQSLGFSLCFQNFDKELAGLPGDYAPPDGRLLLAEYEGQLAGCGALHKLTLQKGDDGICEMKRLWVRERFRGQGLGERLARAVLERALLYGYEAMRLDTLPKMQQALKLYANLGFRPVPRYYDNPLAETIYLEKRLRSASSPLG